MKGGHAPAKLPTPREMEGKMPRLSRRPRICPMASGSSFGFFH